jgi:hypothetical protein
MCVREANGDAGECNFLGSAKERSSRQHLLSHDPNPAA